MCRRALPMTNIARCSSLLFPAQFATFNPPALFSNVALIRWAAIGWVASTCRLKHMARVWSTSSDLICHCWCWVAVVTRFAMFHDAGHMRRACWWTLNFPTTFPITNTTSSLVQTILCIQTSPTTPTYPTRTRVNTWSKRVSKYWSTFASFKAPPLYRCRKFHQI